MPYHIDVSTPPLRSPSPGLSFDIRSVSIPSIPSSWSSDIEQYTPPPIELDSQSPFVVAAPQPLSLPPVVDAQSQLAQPVQSQPAGPPDDRSVHSLHDAFRWSDIAVRTLKDFDAADCDDELQGGFQRLLSSFCNDTYSTACSGIDAPAAALTDLYCAINTHADIKPRDLQLPRCLHAIEWDSACQDELALLHRYHEQARIPQPVGHPHEPCRFGDLAEFFDETVQEVLPELYQRPEIALDALLPVIRRGHGIRLSAPCLTHGGKYCTLTCAKRHIAGTSCTSHSRQGAGAKQYDETIIFFAAWAGLRRRLAEPCIIYENVKGLLYLLVKFVHDIYFIDDANIMMPTTFGWPVKREREYFVLRHRQQAMPMVSPLSQFSKRFHRLCMISWREFFFLEHGTAAGVVDDEFAQELRWALSRPTVPSTNHTNTNPFENALTKMERKHLVGYRNKFAGAATAFQLNQNPEERM